MDLVKVHNGGGLKSFRVPGETSHLCPGTHYIISEGLCRASRAACPQVCINCLIPRADDVIQKDGICIKCSRSFSAQEARAGYITCEHCGEYPGGHKGDAA